jgi:hypothetical protein
LFTPALPCSAEATIGQHRIANGAARRREGSKKIKEQAGLVQLVIYNKKMVQDLKRIKKGLFLQSGINGPIVQWIPACR